MKARVIETGEIIDVCCLYPVTYSRLDCNGKISEEYDEDELEILVKPKKTVLLDKVCEYLSSIRLDYYADHVDELIDDIKKHFE